MCCGCLEDVAFGLLAVLEGLVDVLELVNNPLGDARRCADDPLVAFCFDLEWGVASGVACGVPCGVEGGVVSARWLRQTSSSFGAAGESPCAVPGVPDLRPVGESSVISTEFAGLTGPFRGDAGDARADSGDLVIGSCNSDECFLEETTGGWTLTAPLTGASCLDFELGVCGPLPRLWEAGDSTLRAPLGSALLRGDSRGVPGESQGGGGDSSSCGTDTGSFLSLAGRHLTTTLAFHRTFPLGPLLGFGARLCRTPAVPHLCASR